VGVSIGRRFTLLALAPILVLIAFACWAMSSPAGSSPDDDYHLTSIWCATGESPGTCETVSGEPTLRAVAPELHKAGECFKFQSAVSGACIERDRASDDLIETNRGNFAGSYPPIYYASVGIFAGSGFSDLTMVLLRVLNVAIFLAIAVALHLLLPSRLRSTSMWMWLIGLVPLGVFLIASNNPSAWAVISGGSVWLATLGYFATSGWRRWSLLALAGVTTIMGAGARADAAAYAGIGIIVACILAAERSRRFLVAVAPFIVALVVAGAFFLFTRQSNVLSAGLTGKSDPSALPITELVIQNLINVPSLWAGVFGTWELGWLDTPMPGIVWVGALGVFAAMVFSGIRSMSWRKATALGVVTAALILVPVWVLVQSRVLVGAEVQPRYILPLVVMLGGVALLQVSGRAIDITRTEAWVAGGTLIVANAAALHTNIRRYISGLDVVDWNLNHHVEWWWEIPLSPMVIWLIGSLAFAGAMIIIVRWLLSRPSEATA
jgi:hypothetical protein